MAQNVLRLSKRDFFFCFVLNFETNGLWLGLCKMRDESFSVCYWVSTSQSISSLNRKCTIMRLTDLEKFILYFVFVGGFFPRHFFICFRGISEQFAIEMTYGILSDFECVQVSWRMFRKGFADNVWLVSFSPEKLLWIVIALVGWSYRSAICPERKKSGVEKMVQKERILWLRRRRRRSLYDAKQRRNQHLLANQ